MEAAHRRTAVASGLLVVVATAGLAAGCGGDSGGSGGSGGSRGSGAAGGEPVDQPATARSLVAAVEDHLGQRAVLAAPLLARDLDYDHPGRIADGTLAVEVALDEAGSDGSPSHVRLVVAPPGGRGTGSQDLACGRGVLRHVLHCVEDTRDDGTRTLLVWDPGAPEQEPGGIHTYAVRADGVLSASYDGEVVPEDLEGSDLAPLADDLLSLVADPGVGLRTTESYVEAGAAVPDGVVLQWFGQDNGTPRPEELGPGG